MSKKRITIEQVEKLMLNGFAEGSITHQEIMGMFTEFVNDSIRFQVELGFVREEVKALEHASDALERTIEIAVREVKLSKVGS